ncbi:MAG TPA: NADH-quinone oxidoreductase subunit NuoB [Candidatus Methylomirabilis sp.]|nr:NADH-quinone oxidoreductase subunit NuoB [Candidatus Methylomirabilis sp.]
MNRPFEWLLARSRMKSPWIYCANAGSCNGCDIEIAACLAPRYDVEQVGALRQGSPKHADILLVTGPTTLRVREPLREIYAQVPGPKAVVAVGSCPASGNVFAGSPTVMGSLAQVIPVDVFVPGCPPRPQAVIQGCLQAARLLAAGKTANQRAGGVGRE